MAPKAKAKARKAAPVLTSKYNIRFQGVPEEELVNVQLKLLTQATNELDMALTVAADTPLFVIQNEIARRLGLSPNRVVLLSERTTSGGAASAYGGVGAPLDCGKTLKEIGFSSGSATLKFDFMAVSGPLLGI